MQLNQPNSQTFQTIANLLQLIESLNIPTSEYGILDSGQTLELSSALHEQIKETSQFKAFEAVGNWYCFDEAEDSELTLNSVVALFD